MTFIARIRHHSLVWKHWHGHAKTSGVLHGVAFRWEPSHIYRSGVLNEEQVRMFTNHSDVDLEMVAVSLPELDEIPIAEPAVEVLEDLDMSKADPVQAVNNTPSLRPVLPPEIKPSPAGPPKSKWVPPERFVKPPPRK
jgi:hypothetical protein